MSDRELMQQALDALATCSEDEWHTDDDFGIAQVYDDQKVSEARAALRARLAQPEQEPVAKMREMLEVQGREGNWNYDAYMQGMYNGMEFMVALVEGRDPVFRDSPEKWLHTPPQREWQGLTDTEIAILWRETPQLIGIYSYKDIAREVEAKLKEKNT